MLFSREKFYRGYFEMRFRLPPAPEAPYTHKGLGPNFWLFGTKPPVNWYGEIDIFEITALDNKRGDTNMLMSTVYYSDRQVKNYPNAHTEIIGNKLKNDTSWHTAAAWWTDQFIKFYLDDSLYYTVQGIKKIPVDRLEPMNIIIDINAPLWGRCNDFDEHTQFPYEYEIDYVRVYQEK
jgi:beta-glucanase (GH16 family)